MGDEEVLGEEHGEVVPGGCGAVELFGDRPSGDSICGDRGVQADECADGGGVAAAEEDFEIFEDSAAGGYSVQMAEAPEEVGGVVRQRLGGMQEDTTVVAGARIVAEPGLETEIMIQKSPVYLRAGQVSAGTTKTTPHSLL